MMMRYCIALFLLAALPAVAESGQVANQEAIISKAQSYLNRLKTLKADVEQKNPDGSVSRGEFFLKRPGQMRLVYTSPQPLLILANGGKIFYRENDQDALYNVSSTPADFLLRDSLDLERDVHVVSVNRVDTHIALTLCRPGEEGGASLTLMFEEDKAALSLVGWTVLDAQGNQTHVRLTGVQLGLELSNQLFVWK